MALLLRELTRNENPAIIAMTAAPRRNEALTLIWLLLDAVFMSGLESGELRSAFDGEVGAILGQHSEHPQPFVFFSAAIKHFTDDGKPDLLDAAALALARLKAERPELSSAWRPTTQMQPELLFEAANDVLLEGRVDYTFINSRLRRREAQPLHVSLTKPFEAAITADPRFALVEKSYLQASAELATGHYGASITSSGSMLQAAFEALGARGSDLGSLASDSIKRGFLLGHDAKLLGALRNLGAWITADRSNRGNAHGPTTASRDDAAFTLQIATATVLRLTKLQDGRLGRRTARSPFLVVLESLASSPATAVASHSASRRALPRAGATARVLLRATCPLPSNTRTASRRSGSDRGNAAPETRPFQLHRRHNNGDQVCDDDLRRVVLCPQSE